MLASCVPPVGDAGLRCMPPVAGNPRSEVHRQLGSMVLPLQQHRHMARWPRSIPHPASGGVFSALLGMLTAGQGSCVRVAAGHDRACSACVQLADMERTVFDSSVCLPDGGAVDIDVMAPPRPPDRCNMTKQQFLDAVETTKEHIRAGDVFQLVLSQRFERSTFADPFDIYRSLRIVNPSPYMVFLQARHPPCPACILQLAGASCVDVCISRPCTVSTHGPGSSAWAIAWPRTLHSLTHHNGRLELRRCAGTFLHLGRIVAGDPVPCEERP